jgi:hypothetical protein
VAVHNQTGEPQAGAGEIIQPHKLALVKSSKVESSTIANASRYGFSAVAHRRGIRRVQAQAQCKTWPLLAICLRTRSQVSFRPKDGA